MVETLDTGAAERARRPGASARRRRRAARSWSSSHGDGDGARRRAAIADVALVGRAEVGDEVIVNVEALDLGLGSGGFDIVHVNLTRGLAGERRSRART